MTNIIIKIENDMARATFAGEEDWKGIGMFRYPPVPGSTAPNRYARCTPGQLTALNELSAKMHGPFKALGLDRKFTIAESGQVFEWGA